MYRYMNKLDLSHGSLFSKTTELSLLDKLCIMEVGGSVYLV